jgi:hypothetical protein
MSVMERRIMLNVLTLAGLYAASRLVVMVAVLLPVDTLSGEISSGVIQTVAAKPIRRSEIMLGKWFGHWLVMASYLVLLAGGVLALARVIVHFTPPRLEQGLPLLLLEGTLLLSVSIAGGTRLSTITNGMMAFGLVGLAFIGNWVEQIGTLADNDAARYVGTVASLIMPNEARAGAIAVLAALGAEHGDAVVDGRLHRDGAGPGPARVPEPRALAALPVSKRCGIRPRVPVPVAARPKCSRGGACRFACAPRRARPITGAAPRPSDPATSRP